MNFKEIFEGWKNLKFPKKEMKSFIESTSRLRLGNCLECDFNSGGKGAVISNSSRCLKCGCFLRAKAACLSCSCPIGKWEAVASQSQDIEIDNAFRDESGE